MPDVIFKNHNLKALIKAFSGKVPAVRVGVLGSKTRTVKVKGSSGKCKKMIAGKSNAEIGAIHEFGEGEMPMRSFLRKPISERLEKFIEASGGFNREALAEVIRLKSIRPWVKKIGVVAEGLVAEGFDTGGFGEWKPSNMSKKKVQQTLVETQQLRNSISSEVE